MISPEEITGKLGVVGRSLQAITQRRAQLPAGEVPRYVFLGTAEMDELKQLSKTWGHEWPKVAGQRPKIGDVPIYVVNDENFLSVL